MIIVLKPWNDTYIDFGGGNVVEKQSVEIKDKLNLTIEEAALYSNIGLNKLRSMANEPSCTFCLFIGNRVLIKRKAFEQYLEKVNEI